MTRPTPAPRVPLPPPLFVGRTRELALAREALSRRGVLVVWGLGGIGKSALLRSLLDKRDRDRAVEVRAPRGAGLRELADVVRGACGAHAAFPDDEAGIAGAILDLAEQNELTLLVDDAHELDPAALERLLLTFAHHAADAALLVSTRAQPPLPDLAEQFLRLDPLDDASVATLVRSCNPTATDEARADIVKRSAGSPWLARCLAVGHLPGSQRLVDDLDPGLRRVISALRWLATPFGDEVVDALAGRAGARRELLARALAETIGAGVRLHDVARQLLDEEAPLDPEAARAALAEASKSDDDASACTALALAAALQDHELVRQLVTSSGRRLVGAGLAATVWRALSHLPSDVEQELRLACAAESATRDALEWATSLPAPDAPDALLSWAKCRHACNRGRESLGALIGMAERTVGTPAFRAASLACQVLGTEEEASRALALLQRPDIVESQSAFHVSTLRARCLLVRGRTAEVLESLNVALHEFERERHPNHEAAEALYRLLVYLGRFSAADTIRHRVPGAFDEGRMSSSLLAIATLHALEVGDPSVLASLDRLSRRVGHVRAHFLREFLRFRVARARGAEDEARRALRVMEDCALSTRQPDHVVWARVATLQLAAAAGIAPPAWQWPADVPRPSRLGEVTLDLYERLARSAIGERTTYADIELPLTAVDLRAAHAQLQAECLAARGEVEEALEVLDRARSLAREHGARLVELELLATSGRLCAGSGRTAHAQRTGDEMSSIADQTGFLLYGSLGRKLAGITEQPTPEGRSALRLDRARRVVELPAGGAISLAGLEIGCRLLEELVASGGSAPKGHLVRTVWEQKRYDPARDDKRLQMAIRRLRILLERDPARPEILLTTPDGYALACPAS